jgi:hypothetical protein
MGSPVGRARAHRADYFRGMQSLRAFAPEVLALLAGGLAASLGPTWLLRTERARATLVKVRPRLLALACTAIVAIGAAGAWLQVRSALTGGSLDPARVSPASLLLFGFLLGMPLSLPGVLFAWSEARSREAAARRRKDFVPTKDDRRRFAEDVVRQIVELSPRPREVRASIGGDGGRVLVFEGDIDAAEGERLTAALAADLQALGFRRVEGKLGATTWWSRVKGEGATES